MFDAFSKCNNEVSLNDYLMHGPNLNSPDLDSILVSGNINMYFLRIWKDFSSDRNFGI